MAGTVAGGRLAAKKNLANDPDFYKRIGHIGGSAPRTQPRGFAASHELAVRAGKLGGAVSRRRKKAVAAK